MSGSVFYWVKYKHADTFSKIIKKNTVDVLEGYTASNTSIDAKVAPPSTVTKIIYQRW